MVSLNNCDLPKLRVTLSLLFALCRYSLISPHEFLLSITIVFGEVEIFYATLSNQQLTLGSPKSFYRIMVTKFILILFQLFGGLLIGIGLYAFLDKWESTGLVKVETVYDVILNISLVLVITGAVVFIVSFAGCVGALRENTCLLKFVRLSTVTSNS